MKKEWEDVMTHKISPDIESNQKDGDLYSQQKMQTMLNELFTSVEIIKSNYATKEELAILNGKLDVLACNQQTFVTKAELSDAVYQLTWRMAGFNVVLLSAFFAIVRYLTNAQG
jgi:hypothetical protein